jgi:predicted Zn-dependent peptidase
MSYKKIKGNGYNLHLYNTNKFNKILVSVNFKTKVNKKDITIRNFLFDFLCSSTKKYNTLRLFEIEREELYSLSIYNNSRRYGNVNISSINLMTLDSKYIKENILNKSLDFLYEVLFNPNIDNKSFDKNMFNIVKRNMLEHYNTLKTRTSNYARIKAFECLGSKDINSYRTGGYKKDLLKITPKSLYNYYKKLFNNNVIDIFVIGDFNESEVINKFKDKFSLNNKYECNDNISIEYKSDSKVKTRIESLKDTSQSKLYIIYKVINMNKYEREILMPLYSNILGGSTYSKLFQNVREKNSLAYNINSYALLNSSVLTISGGIDKSNYNKAIKLIDIEFNKMKNNIIDEELNNAKKEIISQYKSITDTPGGICAYYLDKEVLDGEDMKTVLKKTSEVKKKELYMLSNKISKSVVYLLGGKNERD